MAPLDPRSETRPIPLGLRSWPDPSALTSKPLARRDGRESCRNPCPWCSPRRGRRTPILGVSPRRARRDGVCRVVKGVYMLNAARHILLVSFVPFHLSFTSLFLRRFGIHHEGLARKDGPCFTSRDLGKSCLAETCLGSGPNRRSDISLTCPLSSRPGHLPSSPSRRRSRTHGRIKDAIPMSLGARSMAPRSPTPPP